jgi:murein DD-endopeptidase MepM/ murein hydrolase activator NlpD
VTPFFYGVEEITLPDIPQANPSPDDLKRVARERLLLARVWHRKEGPPEFTLPLGLPAKALPKGQSFGVKRVFNGKPAPQPHTGTDYPTPVGTPVLAVGDGTVVLAQDLFYEGNAIMVDHGDGLISMYFHLSQFKVDPGQKVQKGHTVGLVGSTGRATGPHLFFGIRWHNARVNPDLLLDNPDRIPSIE